MVRQRLRVIDAEIAGLSTRLLPVDFDIGDDGRNTKGFRLLDRRAPAFEPGRIDQRRRRAQQRIDMIEGDHPKVAEVLPKTALLNRRPLPPSGLMGALSAGYRETGKGKPGSRTLMRRATV